MEKEKRAGGTKKKSKKRRAKKTGFRFKLPFKIRFNRRYLVFGCAAVILVLVLIFGIRGCGVNHKSPEKVVKELISAYADGKVKRAKDCYEAKKDTPKELQAEIDANIQYFAVHAPEEVFIDACDRLYQDGKHTYVYIVYKLRLENGQEYPCISTYMTELREEKYYILSPAEITEEMGMKAAESYAEFMKTDTYKEYVKDYDTFVKKNPGYEEKIAGKIKIGK